MSTGDEFYIANHGERGPDGLRGFQRVSAERVRILGHSHDPTPPFWRRMWLRLRGKWPVRYRVAGSVAALGMGYNTGPNDWAHSQMLVYRQGVGANIGKTYALFAALLHKSARLDEGRIVYDSWYWTGRTK